MNVSCKRLSKSLGIPFTAALWGLICIGLVVHSEPAKRHWYEFGNDNSGRWERIYYIDGDSVKYEEALVRYWFREEYLDPIRPSDHAFLMESNCESGKYRILESQELPDGQAQTWLEQNWYKVTDEPTGEMAAYRHLCVPKNIK